MTISLGVTGRSIQVSLDEYLKMTDEDFQDLVAHEYGYVLNHPFTETALIDLCGEKEDVDDEEECDDSLFDTKDIEDMLSSDSFGTC